MILYTIIETDITIMKTSNKTCMWCTVVKKNTILIQMSTVMIVLKKAANPCAKNIGMYFWDTTIKTHSNKAVKSNDANIW